MIREGTRGSALYLILEEDEPFFPSVGAMLVSLAMPLSLGQILQKERSSMGGEMSIPPRVKTAICITGQADSK